MLNTNQNSNTTHRPTPTPVSSKPLIKSHTLLFMIQVSTSTANHFITYSSTMSGPTTPSALTLLPPIHQHLIPQLLLPLLQADIYSSHHNLSHPLPHTLRVMILCPVFVFTQPQSMLSQLPLRPTPHMADQVLLLLTRYSALQT